MYSQLVQNVKLIYCQAYLFKLFLSFEMLFFEPPNIMLNKCTSTLAKTKNFNLDNKNIEFRNNPEILELPGLFGCLYFFVIFLLSSGLFFYLGDVGIRTHFMAQMLVLFRSLLDSSEIYKMSKS